MSIIKEISKELYNMLERDRTVNEATIQVSGDPKSLGMAIYSVVEMYLNARGAKVGNEALDTITNDLIKSLSYSLDKIAADTSVEVKQMNFITNADILKKIEEYHARDTAEKAEESKEVSFDIQPGVVDFRSQAIG